MTIVLRTIETSTAKVTLLEPGIIELRYHLDAQFTPEGEKENRLAMESLCEHHGPCCILYIVPAGMKVQPDLMNSDAYREQRDKGHLRAVASVVDSPEMYAASKLYFLYHQQPFEARVFEDEYDARKWLRELLSAKE